MSAPILHGGGVTTAARIYGGRPQDWLDLSTGINPCPETVPDIPAAAWHRLPDQHLLESARLAARDYYHSGAILPFPVPGTQSVIQHLPRLVERGRRVAVLSPTYGEYARAFRNAGFAVDLLSGIEDVVSDHGLVVVVNPNNPDGRRIGRSDIHALHARLRDQNSWLVVDEAFGDTEPALSIAPDAAGLENLIIFRSFGKFFGLAGLRLGFVIARPDVLEGFDQWLGPWAVSGPALSIAVSLMTKETGSIATQIRERHAGLEQVLRDAGLFVRGGTTLFSLVEDARAAQIHDLLCRHHILVRKFDYAADWLRFGLAPNDRADTRLAAALASFAG